MTGLLREESPTLDRLQEASRCHEGQALERFPGSLTLPCPGPAQGHFSRLPCFDRFASNADA
jgi:hypothetical protein